MFISYYSIDGRQIWHSEVTGFNPDSVAEEVNELLAKSHARLESFLVGTRHPFTGIFSIGPMTGLVKVMETDEKLNAHRVRTHFETVREYGMPLVHGDEDERGHAFDEEEL